MAESIRFKPGAVVTAAEQVTEDDFLGDGALFIHAETGERGRVLDVVDAECVTVRFDRTRSVTICHKSELQISDLRP